jgi:chromosome segregation ATPase
MHLPLPLPTPLQEEEACLNEVLAKNAILQAGLDLLNSKTVEGIQADIAKEYKKLAKAEEEEEKIQQQRNRLQNEVNKAKHELDAKEKVVLGKGATLAERDEELQQLKAGTVLVARQAQTEATRAAQLTRAVGSMRAAATALEGEIAQEKQEGAELHAACSEYEKALQEASVAHEAALEAARAAQQVSAAARAAELLQEAALERGAAGDASAEQP